MLPHVEGGQVHEDQAGVSQPCGAVRCAGPSAPRGTVWVASRLGAPPLPRRAAHAPRFAVLVRLVGGHDRDDEAAAVLRVAH